MSTRWTARGRFLHRDGEPWFLLGDTAWELFRRLTLDEADHYLRTRAAQGFNTVLAVALSEFDGLRTPTVDGHVPFEALDPARPVEAYWRHVDTVVERANRYGLVVGILPTWGSNWHDEPAFFSPVTAREYAMWIADRYRARDVIWVLGGDRPMSIAAHRAVVDAFAAGVRQVVGDRHLVTFHPNGHRSSADFLPEAAWVDFDMVQSGHTGWGTPNYQMIEQDLSRRGARPVLDAEPNYDSHPVMGVDWKPLPGYFFDEHDVRRAAYHAVWAGACGHVYGCHEIWQMYDPDRAAPMNLARLPWREVLHLPGAVQMGHLARLMGELRFAEWEPAQDVIAIGRGILGGHARALAHRSQPRVVAYVPDGRPINLDLGRWDAGDWQARWWDPRDGVWSPEPVRVAGSRATVAHPFPGRDGVLSLAGGPDGDG